MDRARPLDFFSADKRFQDTSSASCVFFLGAFSLGAFSWNRGFQDGGSGLEFADDTLRVAYTG
jgi:hypothetical protein